MLIWQRLTVGYKRSRADKAQQAKPTQQHGACHIPSAVDGSHGNIVGCQEGEGDVGSGGDVGGH